MKASDIVILFFAGVGAYLLLQFVTWQRENAR
jgi:hypothetical protein